VRALRDPVDVSRRRLVTGPARVLPGCLVIGAAKAGTSSLFFALKQHPAVSPPCTKEVGYFDLHYAHGDGWYRSHFPTRAERRRALDHGRGFLTLDATPYYLFHPHAARRAAATVPGARIIVLLRDPVERAYSHYHHHRRDGKEHLSFEEAIDREPERIADELARTIDDEWYVSPALQTYSYLARGRYAEQLERWWAWFPRDRVLVLRSEDLYEDPSRMYRDVTAFLDLPAWEPPAHERRNEGGYQEPMAPSTRALLAERFAPENERLANLLGRDLGWM
jgi:hypothetical protein